MGMEEGYGRGWGEFGSIDRYIKLNQTDMLSHFHGSSASTISNEIKIKFDGQLDRQPGYTSAHILV